MKYLILIFSIPVILSGCTDHKAEGNGMQAKMDSLQAQLGKTYKPGLGEFMSGIQVHHAKLWFAGEARNWKLAQFEVDEIKEAFEDIKQFNTDRPEVKSIPMIEMAMDSMDDAIKKKNLQLFENTYKTLTNTCNKCHQATNHEFNVIKTPDTPPFSNQVFSVKASVE